MHNERGSILILTALSLVMLLGIAGLAIDASFMFDTRNRLGAAADAGARAGAFELARTTNTTILQRFASEAAQRAFGTGSITVTVNFPPQNGPLAGNSAYVEAIVTRAVPTFFMRVLGWTTVTVTNRAVAGGQITGIPCVLALDTSGKSDAFKYTGGGTEAIRAPNCTIASNSGMTATGGGDVYAGNLISATTPVGTGGSVFYGPWQPAIPVRDPFAGLPMPTPASPCVTPTIVNGTTLSPGTYCSISVSGGKTLYLNPGVYVTSGFSVSSSTVIGNGPVTIINIGGTINASGGSRLTLSAPTTGPYAGVLFWGTTTSNAALTGGSGGSLIGALYFPNATLSFTGGSGGVCDSGEYLFVIAKDVALTGASDYCNNIPTDLVSGAFRGNALAE